jgi:hypothetical protein
LSQDASAILARDEVIDLQVKAPTAAGYDFTGTLARLCVAPAGIPQTICDAVPSGRVPARYTWYIGSANVFDSLYFVGSKIHNSWALVTGDGIIILDTLFTYNSEEKIVGGLKKPGHKLRADLVERRATGPLEHLDQPRLTDENSRRLREARSRSISAMREGLLSKAAKLFEFFIGQLGIIWFCSNLNRTASQTRVLGVYHVFIAEQVLGKENSGSDVVARCLTKHVQHACISYIGRLLSEHAHVITPQRSTALLVTLVVATLLVQLLFPLNNF